MKRFWIKQSCVAVLGLVLTAAFVGCDSGSSSHKNNGPANISGQWTSAISGKDQNGRPFDHQGTMTIVQNGQDVTGSFSHSPGSIFTFSGTYVDGAMVAIDSDNWNIHLEFKENSAEGTLTGTHENGVVGVENITLAR